GGVDRRVPRHRLEPAAPHALDRVDDAVGRAEVREREASLVAQPAFVDLVVVARTHALRLALAQVDPRVAPDGAHAADGRHALDLPRARLEAVLRRQQRPDGAELSDVAGERAGVRLVLERRDDRHRAAVFRDELAVLADELAEPRAAVAEDAALAVERDHGGNRDRLLERRLVEVHPRLARPVAEREVLQRALAALVADGAVERMVDEDELERRILSLGRQARGAGGVDDHPVLRRERAAGLELRRSLDLDEAHPAGADRIAGARLVHEARVLPSGGERGLDEVRPPRDVDVALVDPDVDELGAQTGASSGTAVCPCWSTGANNPASWESAP